MKFIRSEGTGELEAALGGRLSMELNENKKVLWLVSGGSNIPAVCKTMSMLPVDKLQSLTITLTDERYGEPGHADSNQTKLTQAGFDPRGARFIPYLTGLLFEDTARAVNAAIKEASEKADVVVGFFGMGPDGHMAGILPESKAATEEENWVVGYDGGQFKRITLTAPAISAVDIAYLGAFGVEKLTALTTLQNGNIPVHQQPAQILKKIPEFFVYNDQVGPE